MSQEEIRLLLNVQGGAAVEDLRESLGYAQAALRQLTAAYNSGQVDVQQYLATGKKLERQVAQTTAMLDGYAAAQAEAAAATVAAAQAEAQAMASVAAAVEAERTAVVDAMAAEIHAAEQAAAAVKAKAAAAVKAKADTIALGEAARVAAGATIAEEAAMERAGQAAEAAAAKDRAAAAAKQKLDTATQSMGNSLSIARTALDAGADGMSRLQTKIAQVETEMATLKHGYDTGRISIEDYYGTNGRLLTNLDTLRGGYKTAEDSLKKYGSAQAATAALTEKSRNGMAGFGQSMLQTGRVVQDFTQGGIPGVLNNIEGLTQALGGTAGLAGILTVVGVGFHLLTPYLTQLLGPLGQADRATKDLNGTMGALKDRIKDLESRPLKLAVDTEQLAFARKEMERLQASKAAWDAAQKSQSHYEQESHRAIMDHLSNGEDDGLRGVSDSLHNQFVDEKKSTDEAYRRLAQRVDGLKTKMEVSQQQYLFNVKNGNQEAAQRARNEYNLTMPEYQNAANDLRAREDKFKADAQLAVGNMLDKSGMDPRAGGSRWTAAEGGAQGAAKSVEASSPEQIMDEEVKQDAFDTSLDERSAAVKRRTANEQERSRRQAATAKPILAGAVGSMQLEKLAAETAKSIRFSGVAGANGDKEHLNPQQEFEYLQRMLTGKLEGVLRARGLDTEGARRSAAATATSTVKRALGITKKDQDASIQSHGYLEYAAANLARMRAQGGETDQYGRFHKLNDAQIQSTLSQHMAGQVKGFNPKMVPQQARELGRSITEKADHRVNEGMTKLSATNLNNTQKLITVANDMSSLYDSLLMRANSQAAEINGVSRRVKTKARTRQRRGNGP